MTVKYMLKAKENNKKRIRVLDIFRPAVMSGIMCNIQGIVYGLWSMLHCML